MYDSVKDSGKREVFTTGAHRDTASGKGRYDLLPTYAIHRVARHFENGAVKYGDENWRKGIPLRRFMDSAIRHTMLYLEGHRDEDHAAAAAWNILAMIETEEMIRRNILPKTLDNLPDFTAKPAPAVNEFRPTELYKVYQAKLRGYPAADDRRWRHYQSGKWSFAFDGVQFGPIGPNPDLDEALAFGEFLPVDEDACGTLDGTTPLPAKLYRSPSGAMGTWKLENGQVSFFYDSGTEWSHESVRLDEWIKKGKIVPYTGPVPPTKMPDVDDTRSDDAGAIGWVTK